MRFLCYVPVCLLVISVACTENRQKRFLRFDNLPESLLRLGDYAPVISDQIFAQSAVQHMFPHVTSKGTSHRHVHHREELEIPGSQKRDGILRVPIGRETEGDETNIEVFDPETVKKKKPDISLEENWFRPLVPFSFSFGLLTPWWEGPNVCTEEKEVEESEQEIGTDSSIYKINFETIRCVPSDSSYTCTMKIQSNGQRKTVILRRQCCHGYIRRTDGRPGCSALKMENLVNTMKLLEMNQFVGWLENADLLEKLTTENFTVFAPSNEAIIDYEDETEDNKILAIHPVKHLTDISSIVQGHIVEGFMNVDHLENEQLIDTFNGDVKIRINKYPAKEIMTVNCIPITGKNNFATNGVVHLMPGVLPQPSQTVGDIIETDDIFSTLKKLLKENGLLEELKNPKQSWTLFAPTDDAFRKLPHSLRKQIQYGEACVENVLNQHLVKGTVCTSAVINQMKVKNVLDNILHITRDEIEKLRIDGAVIDIENRLGTNGVLHAVEKVLIPPQAQSVLKSLEVQEREDILKLIEAANLVSVLEEIKNATFFVPSKEAIQNLSNETLLQMENDPEFVKKIVLSHLVPSHTPTSVFSENKHLETMNGHSVHMKLHEIFPGIITGATVQCAYITSPDHQVCGGVMHKINKVILPPKGSILDTLKEMRNHNIITKMLEKTDLEKKLDGESPFTFLAPTDEAFDRFTDTSVKEMIENKTRAEEILKLHILPETLCCSDISHITPFQRQFVRTLDGSILPLHRSLYERIKFGRARALQCDNPATNGLIHSISRVIMPQRPKTYLFGMNFW